MNRKPFYGWTVAAAGCLTFGVANGIPYYNIGFFYDYFQRAFGWSRAEITFAFPLAALLTVWAGPLLVPKFNPRLRIPGSGYGGLAPHQHDAQTWSLTWFRSCGTILAPTRERCLLFFSWPWWEQHRLRSCHRGRP
jgi:hypothetical protein